jgi:hypothetical protein
MGRGLTAAVLSLSLLIGGWGITLSSIAGQNAPQYKPNDAGTKKESYIDYQKLMYAGAVSIMMGGLGLIGFIGNNYSDKRKD